MTAVDAYSGIIDLPAGLPAIVHMCILAVAFGLAGGASRGLVIAERKTAVEFNTRKMILVGFGGCVGGLFGFALIFLGADVLVRMGAGGVPRPVHIACVAYVLGLASGRLLGFFAKP